MGGRPQSRPGPGGLSQPLMWDPLLSLFTTFRITPRDCICFTLKTRGVNVGLPAPPSTGNFLHWLACPTDKFYIIPLEETQLLCCQNLLEIIPKMFTTGRMICSSPALLCLSALLTSKTTNHSVSQARRSRSRALLSRSPTSRLTPVLVNSPSSVPVGVVHICLSFLRIAGLPNAPPCLRFCSCPIHSPP